MVIFVGGFVVTFSITFGGGLVVTFLVTFLFTFATGFATLAQNGPCTPLVLQAAQQCVPPSTCRSYGHPLRSHIIVVIFTLAQHGP